MSERGRSGIYCITCVPTRKRYVGQAASIGDRWLTHRSHLNCGRHANRHLQSAWTKHGLEAFEFVVLEYVERDATALAGAEQAWCDRLVPEFNLAPVAGSSLGLKHPPRSDEFRKRMSEMKMGHIKSPETIQRQRDAAARINYRHPPEVRKKISDGLRGQRFEMTAARLAVYEARRNQPISADHRAALLKAITGRPVKEETRQKIGEANRGRPGKKGVPRPQHVLDAMRAGRKRWLESRKP